jgi:hypothetical protein
MRLYSQSEVKVTRRMIKKMMMTIIKMSMEVVGDLRASNHKMIKTIMTIMIIMTTNNNKEIVYIIKN